MRNTAKRAMLVMTLLLCFFTFLLNAQVTTATLSGSVKDSKGAALPAATVTVEYPDAGISSMTEILAWTLRWKTAWPATYQLL